MSRGADHQDGKAHAQGYNTWAQSKAESDKWGAPNQKPSGGALRQRERNAVGLSLMPAGLCKRQLDDTDIGLLLQRVESGTRPSGPLVCTSSATTRHYWNTWGLLLVKNVILMSCFRRHDVTGDHLQLLVLRAMHTEVLQQVHDFLLGGHLGQKKMREKTLLLGEMLVGAPLDILATNILGSFLESIQGNKYVFAVTDYFMKWVEIFTVPNQSMVTCAKVIHHEVTGCYGCPYSIHSGQSWNYQSTIFTEMCQLLEIQKMRTSPGHPWHNGQVEHFNQTLISMIKSYLRGRQREWDRNLCSLVDNAHSRAQGLLQIYSCWAGRFGFQLK